AGAEGDGVEVATAGVGEHGLGEVVGVPDGEDDGGLAGGEAGDEQLRRDVGSARHFVEAVEGDDARGAAFGGGAGALKRAQDGLLGLGGRHVVVYAGEILRDIDVVAAADDADADGVVARVEDVGAMRRRRHERLVGVVGGIAAFGAAGNVFAERVEAQAGPRDAGAELRLAADAMGELFRVGHGGAVIASGAGQVVVGANGGQAAPGALLIDQAHQVGDNARFFGGGPG